MLLPNTDPVPRIDEVISMLCAENTKVPNNTKFWAELFESERARDFIPFPNSVPQYQLYWTHKKGKKKPQQFWIYCEESQQNYVRVEFCAPGFTWSRNSAIFTHKQTGALVLIENFIDTKTDSFRCLICKTDNEKTTFSIDTVQKSELEEVSSTDLQIIFKIKADSEFPIHPQQGKPEVVRINQNILHDKDLPFPFCYVGKFTFKNREEGWFRLEASLQFKEKEIFNGSSDLFMFNNPRMKKKKHLSCFSPPEIKFMQVYSLHSNADQDYWYDLAMQLGYGSSRSLQLLSLASQIFNKNSRSSSNSIDLPNIQGFSSTTKSSLKTSSNLQKRPAQYDLPGAPVTKKMATEATIQGRSFSLPAMQLNSFQPSNNFTNSNMPMISTKKFRRTVTDPTSNNTSSCSLDEFLDKTPPDVVLHSLSQCPVVPSFEEPPVSIFYQYLTEKMSLESTNFKMLPCKKSISIDQLIIRIDSENKMKAQGGVRHLYSISQNNVVELMDTMDLHSLLNRQSNPVILVSCHDDNNLPSRLLFSSATPQFKPRKRI